MTSPVQQQPTLRSPTESVELYSSIGPYGPPVILGPIVPSKSEPHCIGPQPIVLACHMCNQQIKSVIFHRPTIKTHLFAACLCIFGFWPCICIPYCMHSCSKTDHYCPYCSAFLGSYYLDKE